MTSDVYDKVGIIRANMETVSKAGFTHITLQRIVQVWLERNVRKVIFIVTSRSDWLERHVENEIFIVTNRTGVVWDERGKGDCYSDKSFSFG